jgi:hypothetical protein
MPGRRRYSRPRPPGATRPLHRPPAVRVREDDRIPADLPALAAPRDVAGVTLFARLSHLEGG